MNYEIAKVRMPSVLMNEKDFFCKNLRPTLFCLFHISAIFHRVVLPVQALIKQKMELPTRQLERTLNTDSENLPSSSATSETDFGPLQDTIPAVACVFCSMPIPCKIVYLKREDTSPDLQLKLDQLSEFYTTRVNPLRNCGSFSLSTLNKFLERVKCFLTFCRIKYPQRKLHFSIVDNVDIVQSYITYQHEEHKLNISTVPTTTTALISLWKFLHRRSEKLDSCVQLVRLKNIQNSCRNDSM